MKRASEVRKEESDAPPNRADALLARMRRGDETALQEVVVRYGRDLTRAAWLYLGRADLAEEVVCETFSHAWFGVGRTSRTTRLRSWLFGILFNSLRKVVRARTRRLHHERGAGALRSRLEPDAASRLVEDEKLNALAQAMAGLDEDLRSVVILRYERGLSVQETGSVLDLPEGTVKSRTHRALVSLKERMKRGVE